MATVNVGIDLGTTNTLVCTDIKGKVKCLKFKNGEITIEKKHLKMDI